MFLEGFLPNFAAEQLVNNIQIFDSTSIHSQYLIEGSTVSSTFVKRSGISKRIHIRDIRILCWPTYR